jgi:hypothetical protein
MPLVYVHGVGVRENTRYQRRQEVRDALFRRFLLRSHRQPDGSSAAIFSPYWGDLGARLMQDGVSSPRPGLEVLGMTGAAADSVVDHWYLLDYLAESAPETVLTDVAKRCLEDALDVLFDAAADAEVEPEHLAGFAERAMCYVIENLHPAWLSWMHDDDSFVDHFLKVIAQADTGMADSRTDESCWESLGGGGLRAALVDGAFRIRLQLERARDAAGNATSGRFVSRARRALLPPITNFLGDAMVYLHTPGTSGPIGDRIGAALQSAAECIAAQDALVVVAHSMGANIVYDLLTTELADLRVDLFVSVGTQVGLFEELKLFRQTGPLAPGGAPPAKPVNIDRWINVLDLNDPLGFQVGPVFNGVEDFSFGTGAILGAHGNYLVNPSFHARLERRAGLGAS